MVGFLGAFVFALVITSSRSSTLSFNEGFKPLYGESNIVEYEKEGSVEIAITETTSSGFASKQMYAQGYFETSLKLPESYTAGVVVTFYASNNQKYPSRHDEIDFEFLGHIHGENWTLQTNFYGNGHLGTGREERYNLGFDPSKGFHRYGFLWGPQRLTYYVDDVPIRDVTKVDAMAADFPSKEMRLYATIWNGSDWATGGGRYKMDMSYGPFIATYKGFVINETDERMSSSLTREERVKMNDFRLRWMTYSYCYDRNRYAVALPECVFDSRELRRLQKLDSWTFGSLLTE